MDIIKLLIQFFISYNIHLFDKTWNHVMVSSDHILQNTPKYFGIIKSYDKDRKTGKIQVNGKKN